MRMWQWWLLVALAGGCATPVAKRYLPDSHAIARDQLLIHSDFKLARQHRLLDELTARRLEIAEKLQLPPSDEPIHIYLFETADRYREFVGAHYPRFPDRRAFFVETDTRLSVYAHWGDRVAEDLRHEVSHGYLHATVAGLPLWIDEGLAEFFEVPRGQSGLNFPHVELLLTEHKRGRWTPDLRRLEELRAAETMVQRDYAECWAWMHFLLETTPPRADTLRNHLARLRMTGSANSLAESLLAQEPGIESALHEHLRQLGREAD